MSAPRKEYPQAELSRQLLCEGLLKLMEKTEYKNISVSKLCTTADVARRTFYRHFETIDDVLRYKLDKITDDFIDYFLQNYHGNSLENIVELFFTFWEQHRTFLLLLRKNHLMHVLSDIVLPAMRKGIRQLSLGNNANEPTADEILALSESIDEQEQLDYMFFFMSGGIMSLLTRWLDICDAPNAQEMGLIARNTVSFFNINQK